MRLLEKPKEYTEYWVMTLDGAQCYAYNALMPDQKGYESQEIGWQNAIKNMALFTEKDECEEFYHNLLLSSKVN